MEIPSDVSELLEVLEDSGHSAYLVGGCVRDRALGKEPNDYDATTSADPQEMCRIFSSYRVIETGLKHGTLTVLTESGRPVEITTYRIDGEYDDNRHPSSVTFTDRIEDDLSRRDFTVNAMAYSPARGLCDPFGGIRDLSSETVRCVGAPEERFAEDGLRILRALRFASVLGFSVDGMTAYAVHKMKELISGISRERICSEFLKLICGDGAGAIFREYGDVLSVSLGKLVGEDVFSLCAEKIDSLPRDPSVRLSFVAVSSGVPSVSLSRHLKTSRGFEKRTAAFERELASHLPSARTDVKRLMGRLDGEDILLLTEARGALGERTDVFSALYDVLLSENPCVTLSQLDVSGSEIASATGAEGREIGHILSFLLDSVIDEKTPNEKSSLIESAVNYREGMIK